MSHPYLQLERTYYVQVRNSEIPRPVTCKLKGMQQNFTFWLLKSFLTHLTFLDPKVNVLDSGSSSLGLSTAQGHCIVFLGKTLSLFLQCFSPTSKFKAIVSQFHGLKDHYLTWVFCILIRFPSFFVSAVKIFLLVFNWEYIDMIFVTLIFKGSGTEAKLTFPLFSTVQCISQSRNRVSFTTSKVYQQLNSFYPDP